MEADLHYGLVIYLSEGRIPNTISEMIQKKIPKTSKNYKTDNKNNLTTLDAKPRMVPT